MYKSELEDMLRSLNEYYGLSGNMTVGRFNQWLEKLKDVPGEAISWIRSKIEDASDTMPRNIPKHIRAYYYQWRNLHQDKVIQYPRTPCQECHGKGLIWVKRLAMIDGRQLTGRKGPIFDEVSYRCGMCENWRRHCHEKSKPSISRRSAIEQGFQIVELFDPNRSKTIGNVDKMARKIGKSISDNIMDADHQAHLEKIKQQAQEINKEAGLEDDPVPF